MSDLYLFVCLKAKRMHLSRRTVTLLGNPKRLSFWYDENVGLLYISAAAPDDLDAFDIPNHFWKNTKHSCEVARFAFLTALQFRLGWQDGGKYTYFGTLTNRCGAPAVAFDMTHGVNAREQPRIDTGDDQSTCDSRKQEQRPAHSVS